LSIFILVLAEKIEMILYLFSEGKNNKVGKNV